MVSVQAPLKVGMGVCVCDWCCERALLLHDRLKGCLIPVLPTSGLLRLFQSLRGSLI